MYGKFEIVTLCKIVSLQNYETLHTLLRPRHHPVCKFWCGSALWGFPKYVKYNIFVTFSRRLHQAELANNATLALHWIFVLGQRFDHYECSRLSWLGQLYGAL